MYNPAENKSERDADPAETERETETNLPKNLISKQKPLKCTKRKYERDECEYSSNNKKTLKCGVIRKHTGNLPYRCEHSDCHFRAMKPSILREHMKVHVNKKEYECDMCDYRTNLRSSLSNHKKKKHVLSDEALQANNQTFKCSQCDYTGGTFTQLRKHQNTHLSPEDKPFKCDKCSYTASTKFAVTMHIDLKHEAGQKKLAKILACEKCDFTAVLKKTMDKHVARCNGAHPYTCTKCDYKTAVLKNLYSHAETHVNSV